MSASAGIDAKLARLADWRDALDAAAFTALVRAAVAANV